MINIVFLVITKYAVKFSAATLAEHRWWAYRFTLTIGLKQYTCPYGFLGSISKSGYWWKWDWSNDFEGTKRYMNMLCLWMWVQII